MKRAFLVLIAVAVSTQAVPAQEYSLNVAERDRTTRIATMILGGWAIGNIGAGVPLYVITEGSPRAFHEMNVAWNLVNLGIAAAGTLGSREADEDQSLDGAIAAQRSIESVLLLNMGLDVAYMAAGWALLERGARTVSQADRWRGYGASLLVQGGFLFVFDLGFYLFQTRNRPEPMVHRTR